MRHDAHRYNSYLCSSLNPIENANKLDFNWRIILTGWVLWSFIRWGCRSDNSRFFSSKISNSIPSQPYTRGLARPFDEENVVRGWMRPIWNYNKKQNCLSRVVMVTDKKPQILNCNILFYFKWIVQTITFELWDKTQFKCNGLFYWFEIE